MQPTAGSKERASSADAGNGRKYSGNTYRNPHDSERVALELLGREDVEGREGKIHVCEVEKE